MQRRQDPGRAQGRSGAHPGPDTRTQTQTREGSPSGHQMRDQGGLSAQSRWGLQLGARCVPRDLGVVRRPGPEVATAPERPRGSEPPDPFWAPPPPQPGQASCPQVLSRGLGRLREAPLGPGRWGRLLAA